MINEAVLKEIKSIFGENNFSTNYADLISYSRDLFPAGLIWTRKGEVKYLPEAVVWPLEESQISQLLKLANKYIIPIIPFGGGSGVCGGTIPIKGGIIVDLKRMDKILFIDEKSRIAHIQAGIMGEIMERELNNKGYTMGHFPSSIYCSTLGGWIATRSAGQLSTKYGKIEDMVAGLRVVLPNGEIMEKRVAPGGATGPEVFRIFIGSEGTLGIIVEAFIKIHPYPESRVFQGYNFPDVQTGLNAIRKFMQAGVKPAVVRLYDELDTLLVGTGKSEGETQGYIKKLINARMKEGIPPTMQKFLLSNPKIAEKLINKLKGKCFLVLMFEGKSWLTKAESEIAKEICLKEGGIDLGEAPAINWLENRYKVSYKQSSVFYYGGFVDTIEVSTTWSKVENLYFQMRESLSPLCLIMAHFSHIYAEGCSIYFTVAAQKRNEEENAKLYEQIWEVAMDTCLKNGATISHHHGIGLLKGKWMKAEHNIAFEILKSLKRSLDVNNIMNPGKLGLDF